MRTEFVLAVLAVLAVANGQSAIADDLSCGKQMELEKQCMITIETSPEATMIKDRKKQIMKDCAPNYPTDCHAEAEAAHDCFVSIAKTADTDPDLKAAQAKSMPAIDGCFQEYPPNVREGLEEIFMPMHPPKHRRGHHNASSSEEKHGKRHNASASGSASKEGHMGGGSKSGESKENSTGSGEHRHHPKCGHGWHKRNASSSSKEGRKSGEHHKNPKCEKTKEQKECMKTKLEALAKDTSFVGVMDTLIRQKHKCKNLVNWSCTAKSRKQKKCLFHATEPCREAFMGKMKTCLQAQGFTLPPNMMKGTSPPPTQ